MYNIISFNNMTWVIFCLRMSMTQQYKFIWVTIDFVDTIEFQTKVQQDCQLDPWKVLYLQLALSFIKILPADVLLDLTDFHLHHIDHLTLLHQP